MKALPLCVALLVVLCAPTVAQVRYDVKLERAAMEIIARKIGDIRPSLSLDPPLRRVTAGAAPSHAPARARASAVLADPVPMPRKVPETWHVLRGASAMESVSAGSFQSFSEAAAFPPGEPAKTETKTVSRVIGF